MSALVLVLLLAGPAARSAPSAPVSGFVIDPTGAPLPDARVEVVSSPACATRTDVQGRFELPCAAPDSALRISATGFREEQISPASDPRTERPQIVMQPMPHAESVVVTATRSERQTTSRAVPVAVVSSTDLMLGPPVPLDDALRAVPGFSLFRRSSSRVSNPTTQGASLRGLSASGASRALVLTDGVPINDPFGGWVGWNRVPRAAIERVELVRGGASDLYGADALAGVVQVLTIRPSAPMLRAELSAGSQSTGRASFFAGTARTAWHGTLAAEAFTTDGYILVAEAERGSIDRSAGGRHTLARLSGGYTSANWHIGGAAHAFGEDRENGTPVQTNATDSRHIRIDAARSLAGGQLRAIGYAADQEYRQAFSAIAADRASETLTVRQRVPASEHGASLGWSRSVAAVDVLAGGDFRQIPATNEERSFFPDGRIRATIATPVFQRTSGVFAQATWHPRDRLTVTTGVRADLRERDRSESPTDADSHISPRLAAAWTLSTSVVVRGSLAWSYRAPTLNERYRGFRVGSIETLPNADLRPERLRTLEGSILFTPPRAVLRMTAFRSDLEDAVTNVTISSTPQLITRKRENVGGVRVWGGEVESEWRAFPQGSLTASAALLDSSFVDFGPLEGLRVPQGPAWQLAGGMRVSAPQAVTISAQLRAFGLQFDDDRNTLRLGKGLVVDVTVLRSVGHAASAFASFENIFGSEYDVGRTPTRTVGQPFTAHAGLRIDLRRFAR